MVAVQHYQYLLPEPMRIPFNRLGLGIVAVAAFFLVSGFIVAEVCGTVYAGRPGAFLLNRTLRLVPPYLAALALAVGVHEGLWRAGVLRLWDWTVTADPVGWRTVSGAIAALVPGGGAGGGFEFLPFSWSLRVEIAFYLAAALVCVVGSGRASGVLTVGRVAWAAVAASIAAIGWALWHGGPAMVFDGPAFLAGVALRRYVVGPRVARALVLVGSLGLAGAAFTRWPQRFTPDVPAQLALLGVIVALVLGLLMRARPGAALRRIDARLGALSYPLYLNHYVVGILFTDLVSARGPAVLLAGLVVAVGLAMVMHRLAEVPLERLRGRIRHRRASIAASGPSSSTRALAAANSL